ncbi:hypothetical protein ACUTAF_11405 [Pseudomonas sp. SP16.1]|uniref:hypothetical protein n=1 Tax=Pseudomonas sp. SP16.1 TaxID=3458854 RepID=UPI00404600B1
MSSLIKAARSGALAAIGLYLIATSTLLVLSYASLSDNASELDQPGPLRHLASHLPPLPGAIGRG